MVEEDLARAPGRALPVRGARAVGVLAGCSAHDHHGQGAHHLPWSEEGEGEKAAHPLGAGSARHQAVVRREGPEASGGEGERSGTTWNVMERHETWWIVM